ncbi:MAG: TetR/AcrR family transcriptional regulator [Burkholderiales bacterium]|nr:TetR/AcrR family transcriptional regulator [Burkholderiales bacterium]
MPPAPSLRSTARATTAAASGPAVGRRNRAASASPPPETTLCSPPGEPGLQTPRFLEKREAILDAAARQFNREGVKGATLASVARSVGLIANSLTYYYRRKEDLASACFLRAIEVVTRLATAAGQWPTLDQRIRHFIGGWYGIQREIALLQRPELIVFNEIKALPETHTAAVFSAYTQLFRAVRRLIGPPQGSSLERDSLNARAHLLLSTTMWMRILVRRLDPDDYGLLADRVCDILLDGLAVEGHDGSMRGQALAPAAALDTNNARGTEAAAREPPEATGHDFLRAATALINEQGYRGASIERITARLNLTKGSFYHHHNHKDDLVGACFERTFATIRLVQAHARSQPGNGLQRLAWAANRLVRHQLSAQGPLLSVAAWSALPAESRGDQLHTLESLTEKFRAFIVDGLIDRSVRPLDPSVAAQLVSALVNAAAELPMWVRGATEDNATRLFVRPLLTGLRRT